MVVFGVTDKGIVRRENQDCFALKPSKDNSSAVCVVCDGMGGAKAGNVASKLASNSFMKVLDETLGSPPKKTRVAAALEDAVTTANRVVFDSAAENPAQHGMGTTLVGAVVFEKKAHIINVGDSRAYHISKKTITRITQDHSLVEQMVKRGDITPDEAATHPNRNLITRALGTDERVTWDTFTVDLKAGDALLLCSDGLSNMVKDAELLRTIDTFKDLSVCAAQLLDLALARGGTDNITALLIRI